VDEQELVFILETPVTQETEGGRSGNDIGGSFSSKVKERLLDSIQARVPVPVERLKANVTHLLAVLGEVFDQAEHQPNSRISLDEIELTVEVNAEGQLGILGSGGKAGGKGGITLKFKRK
jgi:hypothetical protein